MWSTQSVIDITKSAIAQLTASGYMTEDYKLTELNDTTVVDLGNKLNIQDGSIAENSPADIMYKALMSQIGKIIIDSRSYVSQLPSLYVDTVNWGLFTEMVTYELSDVMIDEIWNPNGFISYSQTTTKSEQVFDPTKPSTPKETTTTVYDGVNEGVRIAGIEFGFYKPPISAKLYKKCHGIMIPLTVGRDQMFTAFSSLDDYSRFIAGLYNSVENTIQLKAEVYALMTVSMGVAKARANSNEINLLAEYNTLTNKSLTVSAYATDEDFQRYCLKRIADVKSNIQRFTTAYNNHEHITFASEPKTILLNQFANALKFGVRANTYNVKLLGIGEYDTVNAWQAVTANSTDMYDFDTASTISLSQTAAEEAGINNTATNNTIKNVVGVIYDRLAMGITLDKRKTTSQYSASRDTTNFFYHSLVNYIVNDNYPIVSFVIAES